MLKSKYAGAANSAADKKTYRAIIQQTHRLKQEARNAILRHYQEWSCMGGKGISQPMRLPVMIDDVRVILKRVSRDDGIYYYWGNRKILKLTCTS